MKRILLILLTFIISYSYSQTCSVSITKQYSSWGHNFVDFTINYDSTKIKDIFLETGTGDTLRGFNYNCGFGSIACESYDYDSVGVFNVIVTITDSMNQICKDSVLVDIECVADFNYSYDSSNTVQFTNLSTPIDSLSFLWKSSYNSIGDTARHFTHNYGQPGHYYPMYTATLPNNKKCFKEDTISVNMCELDWCIYRDSLQLYIETYSTSFDSVSWNFGDGFYSNSFYEEAVRFGSVWKNTVSPPRVYQVDSTYMAMVSTIDEFGNFCMDTAIVIYEPCYAGFTKSLDTINNRVVLANYSSETAGSRYRYTFGDGSAAVSSLSKNMSHTYSQYGTYEVCVTVSTLSSTHRVRCTDTFCDSVGLDSLGNLKSSGFTVEFVDSNFVTSVEDLAQADAKLEGVTVYPNPSKNIFNVDLSKIDIQSEVLEMELYSTYGGLILKRRLNSPMEKVDLSNYADGLYFLRLSLGDKVAVEKLIKN